MGGTCRQSWLEGLWAGEGGESGQADGWGFVGEAGGQSLWAGSAGRASGWSLWEGLVNNACGQGSKTVVSAILAKHRRAAAWHYSLQSYSSKQRLLENSGVHSHSSILQGYV